MAAPNTLAAPRTRRYLPTAFAALRRALRRAAPAVAALALLWVGTCLVFGVRAWHELRDARETVERAASAVLAGDTARATSLFEEARDRFQDAAGSAGVFPLRLVSLLPYAGRSAEVVLGVAEAGREASEAGRILSRSIHEAGGLEALVPEAGRLRVQSLEELAVGVHRARELLDGAAARTARLPTSLLLPPIASGRAEAAGAVREGSSLLGTVHDVLSVLPAFLGGEGERRYFLGAQNPAELRGTGGLIGSHAILVADEGSLHLGPFRDTTAQPAVPDGRVASPGPDFAERYGAFWSARYFPNINMTPDVPTAARAILALHEELTGQALDGVILIDPVALSYIVQATGPVSVPGFDATLDASTVVPLTTNRAYSLLPEEARKSVLGSVAEAVWRQAMSGEADPLQLLGAISRAASEGHLTVYAEDPEVETGFERAGVSGRLLLPGHDFFAVFASNASGTKIDYYARRDLDYRIRLLSDGSGLATASVTIENQAPASGQPAYVIGPYGADSPSGPDPRFRAGESVSYVSVYCGADCALSRAAMNGVPMGLQAQRELGHWVLSTYVSVPSRSSRVLAVGLERPGAWDGDRWGGEYVLTLQGQTMLTPTHFTVEVALPPGMRVTSSSPGAVSVGDTVKWSGTLTGAVTLEVRFAPPLPVRLWQRTWEFLTRPVVEL